MASASHAAIVAEDYPVASRLALHEVHNRLPRILLTPRQDILIGSWRGGRHCLSRAGVTHVIDHPHVAAVQCLIRVDNDGTPQLYYAKSAKPPEGYPPEGYPDDGTTYLNGAAIPTIDFEHYNRRTLDKANALSCGDIIRFSFAPNAPAFIVRDEYRSPLLACDGSPCSFSLLALDESIIICQIIPCLPLNTLAKFALVSDICAELVASHLTGGNRWREAAVQLVQTFEMVETRSMLYHAMSKALCHVELDTAVVWWEWQWDPSRFDGRYQMADRAAIEQHLAALMMNIEKVEKVELRRLTNALAIRMVPAEFVELVTQLSQTALGDVWPHHDSPDEVWRDSVDPTIRLDQHSVDFGSLAVGRCAGRSVQWTPEELVSMSRALKADGQWLGEQLESLRLLDHADMVAMLAMPHSHEQDVHEENMMDEQADFLIEVYQFGGSIHELRGSRFTDLIIERAYGVCFVLKLFLKIAELAQEEVGCGFKECARVPTDFLAAWAHGSNFPNDSKIHEVETITNGMASLNFHRYGEVFASLCSLGHTWIFDLLPSGGGAVPELNVQKVRAISGALTTL